MTAPTTPAGMPEQDWKNIDEYAPFHPDASHINPDYRDGWNACYEAGRAALEDEHLLRQFAEGRVEHLNKGHCPDAVTGHESRDPSCAVCQALCEPTPVAPQTGEPAP